MDVLTKQQRLDFELKAEFKSCSLRTIGLYLRKMPHEATDDEWIAAARTWQAHGKVGLR